MSGLGRTSAKTTTSSPSCSSARAARPAATTPGSVTSSGRVTPSPATSSPSRASAPGPCTSRVGVSMVRTRSTSTLISAQPDGDMILAYPKALAHASHGLLSLVMLGVSAGFVHGVGFVPQHRVWRVLFGPWLAWALMGAGLWLLLRN